MHFSSTLPRQTTTSIRGSRQPRVPKWVSKWSQQGHPKVYPQRSTTRSCGLSPEALSSIADWCRRSSVSHPKQSPLPLRMRLSAICAVVTDWQSLARRAWYESACYQGGDALDVCQRQNSAGMDQRPRRTQRSASAGAKQGFVVHPTEPACVRH